MSEPLNLTWRQWIIYVLLASLGAATAKLFDFIRGQRRDVADIHKTQSEANELDLKTEMSAAQMLREMNLDIIALEREKARLRQENDAYEVQMRKIKALMKLHNIRFDE